MSVCRFYEWHRTGKQKRPYFIHFKDNEPTVFMKELEEESERFSEGGRQDSGGVATCEEGCVGDQKVEDVDKNVLSGRMLTMAGLFDICVREEVEQERHSKSCIGCSSSSRKSNYK